MADVKFQQYKESASSLMVKASSITSFMIPEILSSEFTLIEEYISKNNKLELYRKVLETITKYNLVESGDKIVLGVSGGPDSLCLLHVLYSLKEEYNLDLVVAHVNHNIRKESFGEANFLKKYCEIAPKNS